MALSFIVYIMFQLNFRMLEKEIQKKMLHILQERNTYQEHIEMNAPIHFSKLLHFHSHCIANFLKTN